MLVIIQKKVDYDLSRVINVKCNNLFNLKVDTFYIYYDNYLERPRLTIRFDTNYLGDSNNTASSLSTNI